MKKNKFFLTLLAFACTSFYACSSSDDDVAETGSGPGVETGDITEGSRFMTVQIVNPSGTKAVTDGGNEKGTDDENKINNLRFYFFDDNGAPITVNATAAVNNNKNFVDAQDIIPAGDNMPNVEKIIKATIVINTKTGDNINVKKIVAVANHDVAALGDEPKSLADLCAIIGDYSNISQTVGGVTTGDNFLMTSSSYAGADGQVTAVDIAPGNLCNTKEAAEANPVNIYIERVVAKVKMDINWGTGIETEDVTFGGETVNAVKLKDGANYVTVNVDGTNKQLYVIFNKWDVTGTAPESYLIKKVGSTTAWNGLFTGWNSPGLRSYWAENTAGVTNTTIKHFKYNEIGQDFKTGHVYCLENAADAGAADGSKTVYDPKTTITNRTQAIIAATLVTVDGGVATALGLVNFGGAYYKEDGAKATILGFLPSKIYTDAAKTTQIPASDVEFVTATKAGAADAASETSPRYFSYLQLTSTAESKTYYDEEGNALNTTDVNNMLKLLPGTKVWHEGRTYYYTDIEHFGADDAKGKYGVVRNHVYDINLTSVKGMGTPVLDPTEVIVPQHPENVDTYIAAQINILSWRIVKQDVSLEW